MAITSAASTPSRKVITKVCSIAATQLQFDCSRDPGGSLDPVRKIAVFSSTINIVRSYRRSYMPSILIQLDEATLRSIDRIAPAAKRQRAEFIRQAVKEAIRRQEYEQIREAYLRQPDSAIDADDWSSAEEWKA